MSDTAGNRHDGVVDQLLLETGLDDDGQLRPALLELRALAGAAPEPSAAVAALMAGHWQPGLDAPAAPSRTEVHAAPSSAGRHAVAGRSEAPADQLAARRTVKRRAGLTALAVAASLTAGGAVAAASDQGFRQSISDLNVAVAAFVTGGSPGSGTGGSGQQDGPQPAGPAPSPAATSPAVDGGTSPAPAVPGTGATAPGSDSATWPGGGSPEEILPSELPDGLPGSVDQPSKVPVHGSPDVPLPDPLPESGLP